MATKPSKHKLPRGVSIRTMRTGERVQIAFSFQSKECRELLPVANITKTYIDYAAGLLAEIRRKITDDTFSYAAYFPESQRATTFAPKRAQTTVGELLRKQLAYYQQQVDNDTLASSTLLGYTKIINGFLIPQWDIVPVGELAPSMLRDWIALMGVTAKTVRNRISPLRSVLDDAVNDDLIQYNPLDRVALAKIIRQTSKRSEYEADPFTASEIAKILKQCRSDERPLIEFWLQTGLRPGELIALPWSNINWASKTIRIDTNIVTGIVDGKQTQVEKAPKTVAGIRDVELSPTALSALRSQKAISLLSSDRVWLNPRTNEPWTTDSQVRKTLWEPLCRRADVRYRNPYQIRHTFASTLLTAGRNPFWLAGQMGHEDVEMVFKVYGHWIDENYQKSRRFAPDSHQPEISENRASLSG